MTLESTIEKYGQLSTEYKKLKKECEPLSDSIKKQMLSKEVNSMESDSYVAKITVKVKEDINEEKMIEILKKHEIEAVKTVEMIDFDVLENMLYDNQISEEVISELDECRITKEIPTLTVKEIAKKGVK